MSQTSKPRILIVDDEQLVLESLGSFLELETDYDVLCLQSPVTALQMIHRCPVDLVISDYLLPEMNGLEFLRQVKSKCPDTIRILLTGYADKENAIKGINEAGLFHYLEKPWDNDELNLIIRNGLSSRSLKLVLNEKVHELDSTLLERDLLAEDKREFQRELCLARQVQQHILPGEFSDSHGVNVTAKYLPALEIGGDFYDIIPLAQNKVAILLADVTGHGVQAALSTALIKFSCTSFRGGNIEPAELLREMNAGLHRILPVDVFVAAQVAIINTQTGEGRIASGGLPFPFLVNHSRDRVDSLPVTGLVLGAVNSESYPAEKEIEFKLNPGDRLIMYTDGLSEVENDSQEFFDETGMARVLSAYDGGATGLLDSLVDAAQEHGRPGQIWDDLTVMAIELDA